MKRKKNPNRNLLLVEVKIKKYMNKDVIKDMLTSVKNNTSMFASRGYNVVLIPSSRNMITMVDGCIRSRGDHELFKKMTLLMKNKKSKVRC
jgi:enoyl reductase-like protein